MYFKMFFGFKLNIGTKKQYENSCFVFQELATNLKYSRHCGYLMCFTVVMLDFALEI